MKQHIISPKASQDLSEIIDYFVRINIDAGEYFVEKFDKKCKYLANFPNMGRSYGNIKPDLRGVPLDNYIIIYRVINSGIEIFRVVSGYQNGVSSYQNWGLLGLVLAIFGGYLGLCLILFKYKWILSIILPLLVWTATGISVFIYFIWVRQKEVITLQNYQISQLKTAEQEAILSRTRKILHRTASDIHDGALQDLKLVMDKIELSPHLDVDSILDKLAALGQEIRDNLHNIRRLAEKMEVTPALRQGLDVGIRATLQDLVNSGKLTLTVITEIQPLEEPELNSVWIEHREEIYRFFREALNNVIQHAQPPHGTATQVCISLEQQGVRCILAIANNASIIKPTTCDRKKGGYGSKMMSAIASELPDGAWEMSALLDGQVQVTLSWRLP